ncbi:MAG TPA: hypothetical protein DD491_05870 [Halieaceae bacterium]|nr:hypothetical protein [Halieaceae bacterium]
MFEMIKNSAVLFVQGRLFHNPLSVLLLNLVGISVSLALCLGLTLSGIPFWIAAIAGAFIGGCLQPWLFRNLRYR